MFLSSVPSVGRHTCEIPIRAASAYQRNTKDYGGGEFGADYAVHGINSNRCHDPIPIVTRHRSQPIRTEELYEDVGGFIKAWEYL